MYSIIDYHNRVIGMWIGKTHYIGCFQTRKDAKEEADKIPFKVRIVKSEVAIKLKPSLYSK